MQNIILYKRRYDRNVDNKRNNTALAYRHVVNAVIFAALYFFVVDHAEVKGLYLNIQQLIVCFIGSILISDYVMALPSFYLMRPVGPEIMLNHELHYLGGSKILHYTSIFQLSPHHKYLYRLEESVTIPKEGIRGICVCQTAKTVKNRWKHDSLIKVTYAGGEIVTAGWLTLHEQEAVVKELNDWASLQS